jgi:eukaryotic-like serine/threonine-protein kinase
MHLARLADLIEEYGLSEELSAKLRNLYGDMAEQLAGFSTQTLDLEPWAGEGFSTEPPQGEPVEIATVQEDTSSSRDVVSLGMEDEQTILGTQGWRLSEEPEDLGRYENLGPLGFGGMGDVHRVREPTLNRKLAMKIIHPHLMESVGEVARFVEEAQISAQLQHPGIVPVHELGQLPDGRLYFTMQEIRGRNFARVLREYHHPKSKEKASEWTFRQLVQSYFQVCEAVAYSHAKGVIHRDLKPSNVMLGEFGEVLLVDWGIAKVKSRTERRHVSESVKTARSTGGEHQTEFGRVAGTPSYMSPEQACGDRDRIDERSDIYALGAMLYQVLAGRSPYRGDTGPEILSKVLKGPPTPLSHISAEEGRPMPPALIAIAERAMARVPENRFQGCEQLIREVREWMDGEKRQEKASALVEEALQKDGDVDDYRNQARIKRGEAKLVLSRVARWAPVAEKLAGWVLEDEASRLDRAGDMALVEKEHLLHAALTYRDDYPGAHAVLTEHYRRIHSWAENTRRWSTAEKLDFRIRQHAAALPESHPDKPRHMAYLSGDGSLSLETEPPGAELVLERYELEQRRLVPRSLGCIGKSPLKNYALEMGSYRVRIRKEGYHEVLYPVQISRQQHWDGVPPEGGKALPVRLPPLGSLGPNERMVPAGWFWSGGDSELGESALPRQRIWVDSFVARTFVVTNRDFLVFLNGLVDDGREAEALIHVPRERSGKAGLPGGMIYGRTRDGVFGLVHDTDGDLWQEDWPVMMIDWHAARAYAAWLSKKEGHQLRLPDEQEWEKSARGVDGRYFPWGDEIDPTWCCMRFSSPDTLPSDVDAFPVDESPYGVRGLAGNTMEWTQTPYLKNQFPLANTRLQLTDPDAEPPETEWLLRGGVWMYGARYSRTAYRFSATSTLRSFNTGFRLVRTPD